MKKEGPAAADGGIESVIWTVATSRAEARGGGIKVADIYFRRNLLLILMGLIDAYLLLWWGDILYLSGLAGTAAAPIWIGGAPGESRPVIDGGGEGLHLTRAK